MKESKQSESNVRPKAVEGMHTSLYLDTGIVYKAAMGAVLKMKQELIETLKTTS